MAALSNLMLPCVLFRAVLAAMMVFCSASLASCAESAPPGTERVVMGGSVFFLEAVLDDPTRIKGLGDRDSIPENGGMLFVFPRAQVLEFVMRDCRFDIDIAYLDDSGRVVAVHTMKNEPRNPGESDIDYEQRLTRYSSRFPARFAVEVRAGTLQRIGVKAGDVVELDAAGLKKRAK